MGEHQNVFYIHLITPTCADAQVFFCPENRNHEMKHSFSVICPDYSL